MVEFGVSPSSGGVAVRALGAHGVAMDVVCFVAAKAIRRRITVPDTGLVAFAAFGFPVLAEQGEVGELVVERSFVELHDIGIPAFMVGMTGRTAGIACVGI